MTTPAGSQHNEFSSLISALSTSASNNAPAANNVSGKAKDLKLDLSKLKDLSPEQREVILKASKQLSNGEGLTENQKYEIKQIAENLSKHHVSVAGEGSTGARSKMIDSFVHGFSSAGKGVLNAFGSRISAKNLEKAVLDAHSKIEKSPSSVTTDDNPPTTTDDKSHHTTDDNIVLSNPTNTSGPPLPVATGNSSVILKKSMVEKYNNLGNAIISKENKVREKQSLFNQLTNTQKNIPDNDPRINDLNESIGSINALFADCLEEIGKAKELREEGRKLQDEGHAEFDKKNYDKAHEKYDEAQAKYDEAQELLNPIPSTMVHIDENIATFQQH